MEDVIKSIKMHLYDRSVSPLFGCFLLSWCIWNYRIILTIFSSEDLIVKFATIDQLFDSSNIYIYAFYIPGQLTNCLFYPSLLTLLYIFVYPLLSKPVFKFMLSKRQELRDIKQEIENKILLTVEESRRLYKELASLEARHEEEITVYREKLSALDKHIKDLEYPKPKGVEISDLIKKGSNSNDNRLDELEEKVLTQFSGLQDGYGCTSESIEKELDLHIDKVRHALELLSNANFIGREGRTDDDAPLFMLRPNGTAYLVQHNLLADYKSLDDDEQDKVDRISEKAQD